MKGMCNCLWGTAVIDDDGNCRCINEPYIPQGVPLEIPSLKPRNSDFPIGSVKAIRYNDDLRFQRFKPQFVELGQTNDYYKYVDPRIYQTGGANQQGTTPQPQTTNTTGTTTANTATSVSASLSNFYNQNKALVLLGAAGIGYMLMKKK